MKALILNSGMGSRLGSLTKHTPKSLLMIGNNTILGHQLDNLLGCGIADIIITTGPFDDKIREYVEENYPELRVSYVKNPQYRTTNYIYSMWLARDMIDDDMIILHGDLVFDRYLLKFLIEDSSPNCVPVNKNEAYSKDFNAVIRHNQISKVGIKIYGSFLAPIYKFSWRDFMVWMNEIDMFVKRGECDVYAEDALNEITKRVVLRPMYYNNVFCMEIDTIKDLEIARRR